LLYYLASTIDYNATKHNSIEYISHDECGAAVLLLQQQGQRLLLARRSGEVSAAKGFIS
jgi:hypothetical protein